MAFEQGYQVAGLAYDYKTNTAKTVLAEELSQAQSFKGSKYIQANTQIYQDNDNGIIDVILDNIATLISNTSVVKGNISFLNSIIEAEIEREREKGDTNGN